MPDYIKNMEQSQVLNLMAQVDYMPGQVVSKTLAQNPAVSLTLFAFSKGEEISTHKSDGDAMVYCIDGCGEITIDGRKFVLNLGETIIMPAGKPHSVFAAENFKMLLIVVFPQK